MPRNMLVSPRNPAGILLSKVGDGRCNSCGEDFGSWSGLRRSLSLAGLLRSLRVRRFRIHKLCFVPIAGRDIGLFIGKMFRSLGVGPAENRSVGSGCQDKHQGDYDRTYQCTCLFRKPAYLLWSQDFAPTILHFGVLSGSVGFTIFFR